MTQTTTTTTMANQGNRDAVHVDISAPLQVSGPSGKERVTRTTWDPNSPAAIEAQERLEAQLKQEYLQTLQREEQKVVPLPEQLAQLRNLVRSLVTRIEVLEGSK